MLRRRNLFHVKRGPLALRGMCWVPLPLEAVVAAMGAGLAVREVCASGLARRGGWCGCDCVGLGAFRDLREVLSRSVVTALLMSTRYASTGRAGTASPDQAQPHRTAPCRCRAVPCRPGRAARGVAAVGRWRPSALRSREAGPGGRSGRPLPHNSITTARLRRAATSAHSGPAPTAALRSRWRCPTTAGLPGALGDMESELGREGTVAWGWGLCFAVEICFT